MTPKISIMRYISIFILMLAAALSFAGTLQPYNANPNQVTVSGISSGGAMAVQVHVAYSATFKGAAIFAGAPYYCAEASLANALTRCMNAATSSEIPVPHLVDTALTWANQGLIDNTANLYNTKLYLFSGLLDAVVHQPGMDAARDFYLYFVNPANIIYNNTTPAGHGWISLLGPNPCEVTDSPFVNNCNIDPEETFFTATYGPLKPKAAGALSGQFLPIDQSEFFDDRNPTAHSVDNNGWIYVPASCAQGNECRVHVSFHGCNQGFVTVGDQFFRRSGLNEWADTNNIIVLYPQAVPNVTTTQVNNQGCWDWWGYDDPNYAVKSGRQMLMTKRMVDRITSGYKRKGKPLAY
jgi:poly(3-hydroxybutyrate) depolymerase